MKKTVILILLAAIFISTTFGSEKKRVVIVTDMTHDDGNSLIRYIYYSHQFETEAVIVTPQLPDYNYNDSGPWNEVKLNASESFDNDGDELHFNWFVYKNAGSYHKEFKIENPASPIQKLTAPDDLNDREIHVVLEVTDNGKPELKSYRRFILKGK